MHIEENKTVVHRFYDEFWNQRRLGVADEIFSESCVSYQLTSGGNVEGTIRGPEEIRLHLMEWLNGFPDLRFSVEEMVAEGDLVVSRSVMRGTHHGIWAGIKPTGKKVEIRMSVTHRILDGKIVADWVLVEALGFFQQIGLVPPTEEIVSGNSQ